MKFILKHLEKQKKLFEKGGKLEKLFPLFEAQDTFLFTPPDVTRGAPHVRDAIDMKRVMITVLFALGPAILFGMWNAGHQHNDTLDLQVHAHGLPMTVDGGQRPGYSRPVSGDIVVNRDGYSFGERYTGKTRS